MAEPKVVFDDAEQYERFMGRWSRAAGEKFLAWLAPPKGADWLDAGCGTGALSELILRHCAPKSVTGIDPAPAQIAHARKHVANVDFQVGDAMAMPFPDKSFDIVASALVLHFIPDRDKAFAEMKRVARPDGVIAGYTWERTEETDFAPYAPMFFGGKDLGIEVKRSALVPEQNPDGLKASLTRAGYDAIAVTRIEAIQGFAGFDDFWTINTLAFHPIGKSVAALGEAERERLREHMRRKMPAAKDGTISHPARAVAFKARK